MPREEEKICTQLYRHKGEGEKKTQKQTKLREDEGRIQDDASAHYGTLTITSQAPAAQGVGTRF